MIDDYPMTKLEKFMLAFRELASSDEVEIANINQDRPVEFIDGNLVVTGPTITTITIEHKRK